MDSVVAPAMILGKMHSRFCAISIGVGSHLFFHSFLLIHFSLYLCFLLSSFSLPACPSFIRFLLFFYSFLLLSLSCLSTFLYLPSLFLYLFFLLSLVPLLLLSLIILHFSYLLFLFFGCSEFESL